MNIKKLLFILNLISFIFIGCSNSKTSNEDIIQNSTSQIQTLSDVELLTVGSMHQFDYESPMSTLIKYLNYDSFLFANLARFDNDNEVVPSLAKEINISEDGKSIDFILRDNMKWHDGMPINVYDVEFSLNLWINKVDNVLGKRYMKDVEIVNDNTVKLNLLDSSANMFLRHSIMASANTLIYPKHIWENVEDFKAFSGKDSLIGSGPFKYDHYDENSKTVLFTAFEDYYLGAPTIKKIVFKLFNDSDSLIFAFKNNEIDCMFQYASGLSGTYAPAISQISSLNLGEEVNLGSPTLFFNLQDSVMENISIREAIYYAIDYNLIAKTVGNDYASVATRGAITEKNIGFNESLPYNSQDISKAKQILDEAGYTDIDGDGFRENTSQEKMKIIISSAQGSSKGNFYDRLAQVVIKNLQDVGIDCSIDTDIIGSQDKWTQKFYDDRTFQIAIGSVTQGVAIIDTINQYLVEKLGPNGELIWSGTVNSPEYLKIFDDILYAITPHQYEDAVYASQQYISDNLLAISLATETMLYPYNDKKFTNWSSRNGNGVFSYDSWFSLQQINNN